MKQSVSLEFFFIEEAKKIATKNSRWQNFIELKMSTIKNCTCDLISFVCKKFIKKNYNKEFTFQKISSKKKIPR